MKRIKQSRKSKLIPRDYDMNMVVQTPSEIMETTDNDIDFETLIDNTKKKNASRKFSVTVAVEEFSDNIDTENISDENYSNSLQMLNREEILDESNQILNDSMDIVDRVLSIEVKNCLGFYQKYIPSLFEVQIQTVLEKWNEWQKLININYRSSPLLYKCYICEKSWWYFYDFREHLKKHNNFILDLEKYTLNEINIVAYSKTNEINELNNFETKGDCPKCGYEFVIHMPSNRFKECYYICKVKGCNKAFPTCLTLRLHENSHSYDELNGISSIEQWKKACEVCLKVYTWSDYNKHMQLIHSVRSDVLQPFDCKKCTYCQAIYVCDWMHTCLKNVNVQKFCEFCFRVLSEECKHFDKNFGCICKICTIVINKQCMEAEHLMTHTDKFVMVKKCMYCEDFNVFLDDVAARHHRIKEHAQLDPKTTNCFYSIIIPKSCLNGENKKNKNMAPAAHIVKEEPAVTWPLPKPEIKIKQEIIDDCVSNTGCDTQEEIKIKEEVYEENSNEEDNYAIVLGNNCDDSERILGIKLENIVKEEQESDYEDDIIKLDFNYPNFMHDSQQGSSQESLQDSLQLHSQESLQLYSQDSMQLLQDTLQKKKTGKNGKIRHRRNTKLYKCHECGFEASHKEYKGHLHLHWTNILKINSVFKCSKCDTMFDSFKAYGGHFTKHDLKSMACPECYKVFNNHKKLLTHITIHIKRTFRMIKYYTLSDKSPIYRCLVCSENVDKTDFFEHWEAHLTLVQEKPPKKEVGPTTKLVPSKLFDKSLMQELLKRLQSPEPMYSLRQGCIICQRHFARRNDSKRHLIEHLLADAMSSVVENGGIKCQICDKVFEKPDKYKEHMRNHGYLPLYQCMLCDKTFSDSSNFTKHKKVHNVNAYTCDTCGRRFQAKISIEKHVKLHETQSPIVCNVCNKVFYFETSFKKHYRIHDRTPLQYRCMICLELFNCLKDKWDHLWKIHKLRSQKADCTICEKSYRKFNDLKRHLRDEHGSTLKKKIQNIPKKQYSTEQMAKAVEAVYRGMEMSTAARLYKVPRVNLHRRIKESIPTEANTGLLKYMRISKRTPEETLVVY